MGRSSSYRAGAFLTVVLSAFCLALVPACVGDTRADLYADIVLVRLGETELVCEVADTPEARALGLSGRASLPSDGGMLFDIKTEPDAIFWMKDMRFPIDIVWISPDLVVVHIDRNVPIADPGIPDSAIPVYDSGGPAVRYVVEMNAGTADEHGIVMGAAVTIQNGIR